MARQFENMRDFSVHCNECRGMSKRARALMRSLGREESGVGGSACLWPAADPDPLDTLGGEMSPAPNAPLAGELT